MAEKEKFATRANIVSLLSGFKTWVETQFASLRSSIFGSKTDGTIDVNIIPLKEKGGLKVEDGKLVFDPENVSIDAENVSIDVKTGLPAEGSEPYAKTDVAGVGYVDEKVGEKVAEIVGGAPETLDTLKEIADALNNDQNLAATLTTEIGTKVSATDLDAKVGEAGYIKADALPTAFTDDEIDAILVEVGLKENE